MQNDDSYFQSETCNKFEADEYSYNDVKSDLIERDEEREETNEMLQTHTPRKSHNNNASSTSLEGDLNLKYDSAVNNFMESASVIVMKMRFQIEINKY